MGNFFLFPQDGKVRVTSPYGWRNGSMHRGVDLASDNIGVDYNLASVDGIVTRVSYEANGAGHWMEARANFKVNGQDAYIRYYHMKEPVRFYDRTGQPFIKVGNQIKQGEKIGIEGNTGRSSGSHLHFEIRIGGNATDKTVDPVPYLWIPKALPVDGGTLTKQQFINIKYVEDFKEEVVDMKSGDKGENVKAYQSGLLVLGYGLDRFGADGIFGAVTSGATQKLQADGGLPQTGIVDGNTLAYFIRRLMEKASDVKLMKAKEFANQIIKL